MSSKRRLRRKECAGKARHATEKDAWHQIRYSSAQNLTPYRCGFCGSFHIGHKKGSGPRPH